MIIDGMMHLEVSGAYWDGLIDEVIEHYDQIGIEKGIVLTTWTESRESNDRTLLAYQKYPDRFIPFGHIRPNDAWEQELQRITQDLGWTGLKLHQGELQSGGPDIEQTTRTIVAKAADLGVKIIKIHLVDYRTVDRLTQEFPQLIWILPHMGCYGRWDELECYCKLARQRENVYLDTSAVAPYYRLGEAIRWAGVDKVTFASDGFEFSPMVEKAKIETLQLPTPFRTPRLTDQQLEMILGGNMARLLGL